MSLSVSEIFYSLQGEGKTIGMPCVFLRLAGCNLMCGGQGTQFDKDLHNGATWRCDTIEVWMKGKSMSFDEILGHEAFQEYWRHGRVIITGGEPLLQSSTIAEFIQFLSLRNLLKPTIEIETNGTIYPTPDLIELVDQWNVSPKLSNSGNNESSRINDSALMKFSQLNSQFKFVISSEDDVQELLKYEEIILKKNQIVYMPAGDSQEQLSLTYPVVAKLAIDRGVRFSPRLHIDIWNQKTGV